MLKIIISFFISVGLILPVVSKAEKLNPERDIAYLGAFRVPSGDQYKWGWVTPNSLVYNPGNNTLISPSHRVENAYFGQVSEFSIPTPVISSTHNFSALNMATKINNWKDLTEGKWSVGRTAPMVAGMTITAPQGTQVKSKLYWLTTDWYNPPLGAAKTLGVSDMDFTTPNANGVWIIDGAWSGGTPPSSRTSRYMTNIPSTWSSVNTPGYTIASGENKINSGGSYGPCLYAIQTFSTDSFPADGSTVDSKVLMCPGADVDFRRGYTGGLFDKYSWNDMTGDVVWPDVSGRSAVMFSGTVAVLTAQGPDCDITLGPCQYYKGEKPYDWSSVINPSLGDPSGPSPDAGSEYSDVRSEPYFRVLWLYDPNDLAAVVSGGMQPYEPQPYAVFNIEQYMWRSSKSANNYIGGIAYDSVNQRIFVAELHTDPTLSTYDPSPLIHVFSLSNSGLAADTTPPPAPTGLLETSPGVLTWNRDSDDSLYIVYRNGKPIVATPNNYWTDDVYNRYADHVYTVKSHDKINNISGFGTVNAPSCSDSVQNGDETGVDCGGSCSACPSPPSGGAGLGSGAGRLSTGTGRFSW